MDQYDKLAVFYDKVISGKDHTSPYVISRLKKFHKNAQSLLELGCGTGDVMAGFKELYRLTGIDSSKGMLKIASRKIPSAKFIEGDIRSFIPVEKFDAVICVYDTLNHITLFNDWKRIFRNVSEMLNEKGVFIFDVNSVYKLNMMEQISPLIHRFDYHYLIMDVKKRSSSVFNWNLKVFENKGGRKFELTECNIPEAAFEAGKIMNALSERFDVVRVEEESGRKITSVTERIYFICKKKSS
ncbi:MAG: class I SAM-dependent methyltransferase [Ignavibacteria bacterium]|nr:class I SAM-dependent methyltransferase [Ignavibacteria bacterium]